MRCPHCGHENANDARFCSNCASPLVAPGPQGLAYPPGQQPGQYPPQYPQPQQQYPPQYQQPPAQYQQMPPAGRGQRAYPNGQPVRGGCSFAGCFMGGCVGVIVLVIIAVIGANFWIQYQINQFIAQAGGPDAAGYEEVEATIPDPPTPTTAWRKLLAEKDPVTDTQAALEAFALAVGPLPGVQTPSGSSEEIMSVDGPVRWLRIHWKELTPEQQEAFQRYLNWEFPPEGNSGGNLASLQGEESVSPVREGLPGWSLTYSQQYTDRAEIYNQYYGNQFGGQKLPYPIRVYIAKQGRGPSLPKDADAWSESWDKNNTPDGVPTRCSLVLFPLFFKGSDNYQHMVIAHEVFHCYQGQISPFHGNIGGLQKWIIEGMAEWAAYRASGGPSGKDNNWYPTYLVTPYSPLFKRSYDAVGFYFHIEESGINMWERVKPMLLAEMDSEAYKTAIIQNETGFTNSWASGFFRDPSYGQAWDTRGSGITSDKAQPGKVTIANKKVTPLRVPAYTNYIYNVNSSADITFFDFNNSGRVFDGQNQDTYPLKEAYFCTNGECKCPDEDSYDGPPLGKLAQQSRLAITGGTEGANGVVVGMKLEDFCKKHKKPDRNYQASSELCQEIAIHYMNPDIPSMGPEEIRNCVQEYMDRFRSSMH